MRNSRWALWACVSLSLAGCSGGDRGPTNPPSDPNTSEGLGATFLPGGDELPAPVGNSLLGGYTFQIDPVSLTGTITPWRGVAENDEITHLSIDSFLKPSTITLTSVSNGPGVVNIDYIFTHPFDGPINMAAPASAVNRADLAICARLLILADLPSAANVADFTHFGGEAIANTVLVANADGYYKPAGLIDPPGTATNTFPYKLVVDEGAGSTGNRVGITNGGNPIGNYRTSDGTGWQASNIANGPTNNGWTGYDVLFQGQAASGQIQLDAASLTGGDLFSFDVAVVGKYADPRQGSTKAERQGNRLPKNPVDTRLFLFRQPYGTIDSSVVRALPEDGGIVPNSTSSGTVVRCHVRDWDARAQESTFADLKQEPDGTLVAQGTSGLPTVTVDIPGVTSAPATLALQDDDSAWSGGDGGPDNGIPGDALYFEGAVANSISSGQVNGTYRYGLFRIEDPENSIVRDYEFHLKPDLTLLTSNLPEIVTYQSLRVGIGTVGNAPPVSTVEILGGVDPLIASGGSITFQTTAESDGEGDAILYDVDVTNDATYEVTGTDPVSVPPPAVTIHTDTVDPNTGGTELPRTARVRYYDAAHLGTPTIVDLPYRIAPVGANLPPTATVVLQSNTPASGFPLVFLLNAENDPELDPVTYSIDYDYITPTFTPDVTGIDPAAPPTTLHSSPAQINPGATPLARVARVQFTDSINTPLNIDLPYTLGPAGACTNQSLTFNFNAGDDGWSTGGLSNVDGFGTFGHFRRGCSANTGTVISAMPPGSIAGEYLTSGDDGDDFSCSFVNDYGYDADYNWVSPYINLPTSCLAGSIQITWDAYLYAASGATVRVFVSEDYGNTWGTPVYSRVANGSQELLPGVNVPLADSLQGKTILIRIQFEDTVTAAFTYYEVPGSTSGGQDSGGLTFDNVRISIGSSNPITTGFTPPTLPCAARSRTYNMDNPQGWTDGADFPPLPNTDGNFGWGGFAWTDCTGPTETQGIYAAVVTASGGLISGTSLNVQNDGGASACNNFFNDYGIAPTYNIVSQRIWAPATCGAPGTLTVGFQAFLNTDDSAYIDPTYESCGTCGGEDGPDSSVDVKAYLSTDNAVSWTQIWDGTPNPGGASTTFNVTGIDISTAANDPDGIRLRFEFVGTRPVMQSSGAGTPFGFYVDNVVLSAADTTGDWIPF